MTPTPAGLFPGGTAVSRLRVYDWPAADGLHGGSPHLHTTSAEGYVVLEGEGTLQTLSGEGYGEHPLAPGTLLWFTPGTVHRLVTSGELEILVVMQNSGLPEAGDAILTFPLDVLRDPDAYARAAAIQTVPDLEAGPQADDMLAAAARRRRDLAIEGYLTLREQVLVDGPEAMDEVYRAAGALVRSRTEHWRELWEERVREQVERTDRHLTRLSKGDVAHLAESAVYTADPEPGPRRLGMCGRLQVWDLEHSHVEDEPRVHHTG